MYYLNLAIVYGVIIMRVIPLKDRILVKPIKEEKTKVGIYLPESVKNERLVKGEVMEVGEIEKCPVKKGDKVIFESFSGNEIKIDDEEYIIVKINDILAKIEGD